MAATAEMPDDLLGAVRLCFRAYGMWKHHRTQIISSSQPEKNSG
jgi:hypothetical protein